MRTSSAGLTRLILAMMALASTVSAQSEPAVGDGAQLSVTLAQALAWMDANNLELRIAGVRVAAAAGRSEQARAYPNPRLSLTHENLDGSSKSYRESYLFFDQPIEWRALRRARADSADRSRDVAEESRQAERLRLAYEVSVAYLEAVGAEEKRAVLAELAVRYERAERAAEAQVREGELSGYRLRRLRVERMRFEILLAEAAVDVGRTRRRLALLVLPEGDARTPIPSDPFLERPPALSLEDALVMAAARPELRGAEQRVAAEEAMLDLAEVEKRPEPVLTGGYKEQSDGLEGAFLGAAVRLPLFDRNKGEIAARTAQVELEKARLQLVRRSIENEVRDAFVAYSVLGENLELLRDENVFGEAEALLGAAQVSYTEGEMSLLELLDAAEAYRDARLVTRERMIALWIAYCDLLRATGTTAVEAGAASVASAATEIRN